jgi:hypothetical protein
MPPERPYRSYLPLLLRESSMPVEWSEAVPELAAGVDLLREPGEAIDLVPEPTTGP